jgi:hypothetical protein
MRSIRIPKAFYDDHVKGRDLPAPPVLRATSRHYWIDMDHEDMGEFVNDAEFYVDMMKGPGFDADCQRTICRSAFWTLKSLHNPLY